MNKPKEEQAKELGNSITNIKDIEVPRYVINPGLYIGFIKGWEAAMESLELTSDEMTHLILLESTRVD